jgi:hypothetical protein
MTDGVERYTDQTSLVKSVRVDLGSFMSIRDKLESLASLDDDISEDILPSVCSKA